MYLPCELEEAWIIQALVREEGMSLVTRFDVVARAEAQTAEEFAEALRRYFTSELNELAERGPHLLKAAAASQTF